MTEHDSDKTRRLKGIAVSSGIIIGEARLFDRSRVRVVYQYFANGGQVSKEVERLREALRVTEDQLVTLKNHMPDHIK